VFKNIHSKFVDSVKTTIFASRQCMVRRDRETTYNRSVMLIL